MSDKFLDQFSKAYQSGSEAEYGSSRLTGGERETMRNMFKEALNRIGQENIEFKEIRKDKEIQKNIRKEIINIIKEKGWELPKSVSVRVLAEAAVEHACVV